VPEADLAGREGSLLIKVVAVREVDHVGVFAILRKTKSRQGLGGKNPQTTFTAYSRDGSSNA
jgi:hypothetical protein